MAVMAPMLKKLTLLMTPPLVLRPPVAVDLGVFVELELTMEEGGSELGGVGVDTVVVVVVDEEDDRIEESLKVEVGGEVVVTEGIVGMEVGLSKQTSDGPELTVITGVSLPSPLESPRTITTLVPAGSVTRSQVKEVSVTLVKAAAIGPSALPVWKDCQRCENPSPRTRHLLYSQG